MKIMRLFYLFICLFLVPTSQSFPGTVPNEGCTNATLTHCFLNATIQALFHTQPLQPFLENPELYYHKNAPATLLSNHILAMRYATKPTDPKDFRQKITTLTNAPEIKEMKTEQHDAATLITYLIRKLTESNVPSKAAQAREMFEINSVATLSCGTNPTPEKSHTKKLPVETDFLLRLPIADMDTLKQCLDNFTKKEEIRIDPWRCQNCLNKNKTSFRHVTFQKLPQILVIQLKRFQIVELFDPEYHVEYQKINAPVTFPLELNMTPYLSMPANQKNAPYSLYAVVIHQGPDITSGHYFTYAKWHKNQNWYLYNDLSENPVEKIDNNRVIQDIADSNYFINFKEESDDEEEENRVPYLLFYERTLTLEEKITQLKNALETLKKSLIQLAGNLQETKKKIGK